MKLLKNVCVTAMAIGGTALCAFQPVFGQATSMDQVRTIRVESNVCPAKISEELTARGFTVSQTGPSDAVLKVDMTRTGSVSTGGRPLPVYSAKLHGENDTLLFLAAGDQEARNPTQLCKGIAEDIANRLLAA